MLLNIRYLVGIFAIFHGYAHGEEIPSIARPTPYIAGFMMGTILLHITGLILADISTHYKTGKIIFPAVPKEQSKQQLN